MTAAMQPHLAPAATSMTSGTAIDEANVGQLAEIDARLSRTLDRPASRHRAAVPKMPLRQRLRRPLLILFPVMLAAFGTAYYLAEEPYVSTDDAFVRAAKESVNARVAGQVVEIAVKDNQQVQRGELLFQIDPEPYRIAVDQAEARLASARLQINGLKATYRQQLAELQSASATEDFDEREYARRKALVTDGWTPREDYDQADMNLKVARQHVASTAQQIANTVAALDGDPNIEVDRHPTVRAAKAQLDQARLDLSYATVYAPDDGIVARVDDLQVGDYVNPGAAVFSMMSSRRIWIEANFRETGLTHMRQGQEAGNRRGRLSGPHPQGPCRQHEVRAPDRISRSCRPRTRPAIGSRSSSVCRYASSLTRLIRTGRCFSGISVTVQVDTGCHRTWRHPLQAVCATAVAK